jgi:hypothetical protein
VICVLAMAVLLAVTPSDKLRLFAPRLSDTGTVDTAALANTAVTPGAYTLSNTTVDAKGRVTSASSYAGTSCTNQFPRSLSAAGAATCATVTASDANSTIAQTGVDINTSHQVTATHLAAALPVTQGGTGAATLTGLALGSGTSAFGAYGGTSCTNQFTRALNALGVATCATITTTDVDSTIARTGTDINTSHQVTATHLAAALPVNQGGTGALTLTGYVKGSGSSALTAAATVPAATDISGVLPGVNGGGLVLLEQHTASASASLDFTTALTSTYDNYLIEFLGLLPATNGVAAQILVSTNGGSTWSTSSLYDYAGTFASTLPATGGIGASGTTACSLTGSTNVSSSGGGGLVGTFRLMNPGSTSLQKSFVGQVWIGLTDSNSYNISESCVYKATTAVNAFQFKYSSGNIASGTIRVSGIAK